MVTKSLLAPPLLCRPFDFPVVVASFPPPIAMFRALLRSLTFVCAVALLVAPLGATSVSPPTFSQLTGRAESIFRGEVTTIRTELVTRGNDRAIFTYVTFRIQEILKGTLPAGASADHTVTLDFLGGSVGELTMDVVGIPRFSVGQTELLFVEKNGQQICPLVAMMFGRYRIQRHATTGAEWVARDNGAPLTSTDDIALPLAAPALEARLAPLRAAPLTPAAFSALIRDEALRVHTP